jgi:hypothetical protein
LFIPLRLLPSPLRKHEYIDRSTGRHRKAACASFSQYIAISSGTKIFFEKIFRITPLFFILLRILLM